ncbi:hypothetical protein BASA61_002460 [Batrachochytrium salamandrivorans]|nr:hypothetical protein BASA61_002460 [Batrachochytrium salamandrivorans]KAH9269072.1 hypothetical protein BASA83_008948 [Batrachochytrium salamandrivorans]
MKTASILVISLLAIIGGAAPAPALDGDGLQLYKRQAPPESPIPALRSFLLAKLGKPNSNDGTKNVKTTVHNRPAGESGSLGEPNGEEDNGSDFKPMAPGKITTPEFNQQSNVKGARKRQAPPPPETDPPSDDDEDSNANDETKDVKDEPFNKPTEEVGSSKASQLFESLRKITSGFKPRSKLGKSEPKGNDDSGSDSDLGPDNSEPQPMTPGGVKALQSNRFIGQLEKTVLAMHTKKGGLSGAPQISESNVHPKPVDGKTSNPGDWMKGMKTKALTRLTKEGGSSGEAQGSKGDAHPKSDNVKIQKPNGFADELQRKMAARQARGGGSSEEPQSPEHDVDPNPKNSESNSGGVINGNDDSNSSSQQSKVVGAGVKVALPPPVSLSRKWDPSSKGPLPPVPLKTGGKPPNFDPNQSRSKPVTRSKHVIGSKPVVLQPKPKGQDADNTNTVKEQTKRDPSTSHQQESSLGKTPPKPAPRRLLPKKE